MEHLINNFIKQNKKEEEENWETQKHTHWTHIKIKMVLYPFCYNKDERE